MLLNLFIQKGRIEMPEKRDDITKAIELLNKNVIEACFKYGLSTKFDFGLEVAALIITNCDNPQDTIDPFKMPVKVPEIMMCNEMQNIGGAKTFAKRYLYSDAFEISQMGTC